MKCRMKISLEESSGSSSFVINESGVQIPFWALFEQKAKGGIWLPKIDSKKIHQ